MNNNTKADIDAAREYYETHSVEDEIERSVPGEPITSAMSGYSVRLPTDVLEQARKIAADRGMTTGAWLREAIENAITAVDQPAASVPIAELVALVAKYDHSSKDTSAGSPYRKVTPGTVTPAVDRYGAPLRARSEYDTNALARVTVGPGISGYGTNALANWAGRFPALSADGWIGHIASITPPELASPDDLVITGLAEKVKWLYRDQDACEAIVRTNNTVKRVTVQRGTNPPRRGKS
ncbi:hypothetical protein [Nocardia salmonicida]|uniref:hypothetical protein n=1 Tax=Nocardia salmonicida TaxID=53431 RepID=UPI0007A38E7A|nr:hypothetical protein [Nocardia salmonicida]